jgi:phosphotransferase system enzyme I (PtsI)
MITSVEEVRKIKEISTQVRNELKMSGISFQDSIEEGIMIETPAAAVSADTFAAYCDFFSIGTNDLTQYSLGIDRENPAVAHLFSEFHPAVFRMIRHTVTSALDAEIPVSVCGEMAAKPEGALALLGLGVRTLSMSPRSIPRIKELLSRFTTTELKNIMDSAIRKPSSNEICRSLSEFINRQ